MESKYFAELLGAFAGDGWMSKGSTGVSLFITGNPKDEKEYYDARIKFLFKKVFQINVSPKSFSYWGTYGICVGKKAVTEKIISSGMPIEKKCNKVTVSPSIVSDPQLHTSFIRGLFDTDGCIYFKKSYNFNASKWQKQKRHRPVIQFKTVSQKLAEQIQQILFIQDLKFNIYKERPYNGNYAPYALRLEGKENAKKFFATIRPKNKKHLDKFYLWRSQGFY
ncbi:MAG: hypothetical protein NTZ73_03490 [Candidatus Diapherotrites archaeon]|nr:hypothetical protein [Candidatus Diapherotrites archaeon]